MPAVTIPESDISCIYKITRHAAVTHARSRRSNYGMMCKICIHGDIEHLPMFSLRLILPHVRARAFDSGYGSPPLVVTLKSTLSEVLKS